MDRIILIGTGKLSEEISSFILKYNLYEIEGYAVNRKYLNGTCYMDKPVYAIEDLEQIYNPRDIKLFITASWYNYLNRVRIQLYDELKQRGFSFANVISPYASIHSKSIGEGNWINDYVYLGYKSEIGNNNIFLSKVSVDHYSIIGNHNSLISGTSIGGHVKCGNGSFFGLNSTVFNRVMVGDKCVIGGGAIASQDLEDYSLCVAPQSFIKHCSEEKIEEYISPKHLNRTVEEFEIITKQRV
ncbi:MAG: hypothetical protein J5476_07270 [Lachnospiraceae bacterium]|nr:hypothetical protein [Lachnospiraceae bacterium]